MGRQTQGGHNYSQDFFVLKNINEVGIATKVVWVAVTWCRMKGQASPYGKK